MRHVLVMFSHFGKAYEGMVFSTDKNRHARRTAARYAETVLHDYLQGQEKDYAVRQVINELQALFHTGAVLPCQLIEDALKSDDEDAQAGCIARALHMIEKQVQADCVTKPD